MSALQDPSVTPQYRFTRWLALSVLALALVVAAGVRLRLLDFPLERDEGEYAYAGQLILEGIPPYQLACNMKMPGIYLAYALGMAVFGQTPAGIHLALLVVHLATLAVLFVVARRFLDLYGAVIATVAYALMTLSPAYLGIAAHATHFVMLPALLGIWVVLRWETEPRLRTAFGAGCLFGVAFLMKQPGMFFGFFGGLYLGWVALSDKWAWRRILTLLAVYSLGCLLPFLAVCVWLKAAGVFPLFWFWTISYAREYAAILPFEAGFANAKVMFAMIFRAMPLLWILIGLGLITLCRTRMESRARIFLAGFLLFSFLAVCPGFYFRNHYFIVLLPAVAVLAGLAVSRAGRWFSGPYSPAFLRHLPFLLASAACAQSLESDHEVLFTLSPREACRAVYSINPFPESLDIARHIERHTRRSQRIVVIGSEPQIYFYARRHSSTGQIYAYPLMEPQPFARKMQEDMIREIEQNPPEYLVYVGIPTSWLARPDSSTLLLDWVNDYVNKNMQADGLIQFTGPNTIESIWGPEAATARLRSQYFVYLFKKKDQT